MTNPIVLGLDPGFANCGWCLVRLDPDGEAVVDVGLIRTAREAESRSEDNARRARQIYAALRDTCRGRIDAICAESMSTGPLMTKVTVKQVGMVWGVIAALAEETNTPLVQATPQFVRKTLVAATGETVKEDVARVVLARWPAVALAMRAKGIPAGMRHHTYDALGVVVACLECEALKRLRRTARAA